MSIATATAPDETPRAAWALRRFHTQVRKLKGLAGGWGVEAC